MTEDQKIEQRNIGAEIAARQLLEIARSGTHFGHYGSPIMQQAADEIVKLRARLLWAEDANVRREERKTNVDNPHFGAVLPRGW